MLPRQPTCAAAPPLRNVFGPLSASLPSTFSLFPPPPPRYWHCLS